MLHLGVDINTYILSFLSTEEIIKNKLWMVCKGWYRILDGTICSKEGIQYIQHLKEEVRILNNELRLYRQKEIDEKSYEDAVIELTEKEDHMAEKLMNFDKDECSLMLREGYHPYCSENHHLIRSHISYIAFAPQFRNIEYCDFSYTQIGYDDIVLLWRSLVFGSHSDKAPIYQRHYNRPLKIIAIKVKGCPVVDEYKKLLHSNGKRIFPLPLRDKFDISYSNGKKEHGIKQLIVKVGKNKLIEETENDRE